MIHISQCNCQQKKRHHLCSAQCQPFHTNSCSFSHYWGHLTHSLNFSSLDYYAIKEISSEYEQIELDLARTFPTYEYFASAQGKRALSSVLNRLANFMPVPGYVQGMNYIVAALLWHSSEAGAFWLTVKLMNDYNLRDNFVEGLPGLMQHLDRIDGLVRKLWPDLHAQMERHCVVAGMYATDWCITLFCNVIPLNKLGKMLTYFFKEGWEYFYKLSLEILERLKKKILKEKDRLEILEVLKPYQASNNQQDRFLESITLGFERKNWDNVLKAAKKRKLIGF
jgi:hypothetical protein